jgi:hypothetical protein
MLQWYIIRTLVDYFIIYLILQVFLIVTNQCISGIAAKDDNLVKGDAKKCQHRRDGVNLGAGFYMLAPPLMSLQCVLAPCVCVTTRKT